MTGAESSCLSTSATCPNCVAGVSPCAVNNRICKGVVPSVELLKMKYCLGQVRVPEYSELKKLQKMQIKELTHISLISAPKCNGESENREILHGSEEDSGQRGTMYKILFQLSIKQAVYF